LVKPIISKIPTIENKFFKQVSISNLLSFDATPDPIAGPKTRGKPELESMKSKIIMSLNKMDGRIPADSGAEFGSRLTILAYPVMATITGLENEIRLFWRSSCKGLVGMLDDLLFEKLRSCTTGACKIQ
jgi:hypothetical protein